MTLIPDVPLDAIEAHRLPAAAVAQRLATDLVRGLQEEEARTRLARAGPNELAAPPSAPAWRRLLAQFHDTLVVLLLVATAISAALWAIERDAALPYEAMAILAVVVLNATMGFLQGARADAALAALRAMSAPIASVLRDGERRRIPASRLVPGDLMLIEEGDAIPADGRLVASAALQTAEAALTGESQPVSKDAAALTADAALADRRNMVFSGTTVNYGHGRAVVTATGMRTEVGRIATLLQATGDDRTPLQRELDRTGRLLGAVVVAIAVTIVATVVLLEDVRGLGGLFDVFILGVALAVAAVPEGLPAVVTVVLSVGVRRMASRRAIVRHLAAVETLGSATVIASDKTGTLTRNEMTVRVVLTASGRAVFDGSGYGPDGAVRDQSGSPVEGRASVELGRALTAGAGASNASVVETAGRWTVHGDPTEAALIVAARKFGLHSDVLATRWPRLGEVPFSAERKLMSTLHRDILGDGGVILTKGAPEVLLPRCSRELVGDRWRPLTPERRAVILGANEALAGQALRTLGVAERAVPGHSLPSLAARADEGLEADLVFIGVIGMIDPPRTEAGDAVARARRAGIRSIMITGDHPRTAIVLAGELGIGDGGPAVTGADIEGFEPGALDDAVTRASVYARVSPDHKLRIVQALRRGGAVVAMTGDGVNDAPALKRADIGVAMGITGTDVAKGAADIVLADDHFATIVAAVEEGRAVFDNIRKFLRYLLSSNVGEVMTMFGGLLLAGPLGLDRGPGVELPLLATQILWINLVTDGPPALALGLDAADAGVMTQPPRPLGERVITAAMWRGIVLVGAIMATGTLLVLDASLPGGLVDGGGDLRYAQTRAFTTLMLFQVFNVFNARSDTRSAFAHMFRNHRLSAAVVGSVALQVAVVHLRALQEAFGTTALSLGDWVFCAVVASSVLWLREADKVCRRQRAFTTSIRSARNREASVVGLSPSRSAAPPRP